MNDKIPRLEAGRLVFFRTVEAEVMVSGQLRLLAISVGVEGPLDPETGMICDLVVLNQELKKLVNAVSLSSGMTFADWKLLQQSVLQYSWNFQGMAMTLKEVRIQDVMADAGLKLNSIELEGVTRLLHFSTPLPQKIQLEYKSWSDFIDRLQKQSWSGEILDPLNQRVLNLTSDV